MLGVLWISGGGPRWLRIVVWAARLSGFDEAQLSGVQYATGKRPV